jgi:hypothetical protein
LVLVLSGGFGFQRPDARKEDPNQDVGFLKTLSDCLAIARKPSPLQELQRTASDSKFG